jgi:catechol 2,3-dioxygenase-like lactoylglutathione lyase family enzyme
MTSRIAVIVINALDPPRVASFWCDVLGWQPTRSDDDVISIAPRDGQGPTIDVVAVPDRKSVFNRLHLDLRADGAPFDDELRRLLGLGAREVDVGQPDDVTWVVLADPEGNEFCLLRQTVQEVG